MCYCDKFGSFDAVGNSINVIGTHSHEENIKVKTYLVKAENGDTLLRTKYRRRKILCDYVNFKTKIDEYTESDDYIINYCPFCGRKLKESE